MSRARRKNKMRVKRSSWCGTSALSEEFSSFPMMHRNHLPTLAQAWLIMMNAALELPEEKKNVGENMLHFVFKKRFKKENVSINT